MHSILYLYTQRQRQAWLGTNLIHGEKHDISRWVFDNMSKFTDHSRIEFEKFAEILWAFFSVI